MGIDLLKSKSIFMKKSLFTLLLVLASIFSNAQLRFYTNGGKTEVKQGSCGMADLSVKVPLPAGTSKYDRVRFFIFLTPNAKSTSQAVYHCVWKKQDLAGKSEVMVDLKTADGSNDFYYGGYGIHWGSSLGSASALDIDKPCSDENRADQIWNLSFELEGSMYTGDAYIDGMTDGLKRPTYQATSLKSWDNAFPFDYGYTDPNIYTTNKTFSIKKKYDVPVDISAYEDEMSLSVASQILCTFKSYTNTNTEEVKQDIIKAIKNKTLLKSEETKFSWNLEICYPCFAKKIKASDDTNADATMKSICTNQSSWKPAKVGGKDGFVLDIPKTLHMNRWSPDYSNIRTNSEVTWAKFMAFVVESNGMVYTGIIEYREGANAESPIVEKLFNDIYQSFKIY